ncbi:MAG: phosphoribosylformylglycinamidine synthase I [Candidatus Omnitrophica bacterium]|nr:phosphoribosylformylglycinamidine synthase I [Candidatus Omnitrophota bacterium]MDD5552365.1 phosphoribosylformylglycinamidine synthase I [Candidatus Omnitrophota bacterium]
MAKPKVCVLRTAGTNCDKETAFAFSEAGASAELAHINSLFEPQKKLSEYDILAIPGGFSYGDDVAAGKILANELRYKLIGDIKKFIQDGKLIIGICNGFQVLVRSGLLPGSPSLSQEASLIINDSGKFEDRWVHLKNPKSQKKCIWTKGLPGLISLPIAHGEGKFVVKDKFVLERIEEQGQIVFQYCDEEGKAGDYPVNPNGSTGDIAGICDETGRIFGLMPHPERHISVLQHPRWPRSKKHGDGSMIFANAVNYCRRNL